jgi:transcriptional regulator GlxA family with amidase domain
MVRKDSQPDYVLAVKKFIEENYRYPLDVARIASEVACVSMRTLQTAFFDAFGVTMQELQQETRINNAKILLLTTNKTIKEIAVHVGYADTSAFDHFFQKMTNTTPEQYRRVNT